MYNECRRSSAAVNVPCVYDFIFIAKAMLEKTTIHIEGVSGTVDSLARTAGGLIIINFTNGSMVTVEAR